MITVQGAGVRGHIVIKIFREKLLLWDDTVDATIQVHQASGCSRIPL